MIERVCIIAFSRMSYFVSINITRESGIIITDRATADKELIIIVNLSVYFIDILQLTEFDGALGHAIYNSVLIFEVFHIPPPLLFRLL